ncbi:class I SAM-dependent methyltransferase [Sulfuricystis multivorans]|uniref:class I SAM-dependent methyltransferase n=1 Tax=Sulfuricystis multivorans TaxID=2211108 RepID=UPI0024DFBB23|nr:class I SAM-dependent methyltransferase [Sulfuricystis multivorans]
MIPPDGEVLDLACGYGRHARFLAGMGLHVEAVDRDAEALAALAGVANVTTRHADLENGPWPYYSRVFDGIVVSRYLWRPLFPQIFNCLAEGGVLIYETFMEGQQLYGKPENPAHLLRPGELLELVGKRFTVIAFEQGEVLGAVGDPQVIQRICVRRGRPVRLPECVPPP